MEIIETLLPILLIALAGYLAARTRLLSQVECDAIAKFVFTFLIPSLLFLATARAQVKGTSAWEFLLSYYGAVFLVYLIGALGSNYLFNHRNEEQSVMGMGAAYSNCTIVGIPVCMFALGAEALTPLLLLISVHNLILFGSGIIVAERSKLSLASLLTDSFNLTKQLISSPITASLLVGAVINIADIPIYAPVESALDLFSQAAVPSALFVLGTSINKYQIRDHVPPALLIIVLKLFVLPALVWLFAFKLFQLDPLWSATALITAAMPVGISPYIFAKRYQAGNAVIATSIVVSTLISIITLTLLISWLSK